MIDMNDLNLLFSTLTKKIIAPASFGAQCDAITKMLKDDVTGLVDSLTDFSVETASVEFSIESDNKEYARILNKWLKDINREYRGRIPTGIDALAREYYKERWKASSFPVLKMGNLKRYDNGLMLPTRMFFVDGSSIRAKEKRESDTRHLENYDYYLGDKFEKKYLLAGDNVIFARCFGRWFDKQVTPYLIKRGVWHNSELIKDIKDKQSTILGEIIPYMMLVKKGDATLVKENIKAGYTNPELQEIKDKIETLANQLEGTNANKTNSKTPIRVTNFDENIEHLIPNLENIFKADLTQSAERNILSGLGFIDIVEATSTSRKESILNPKAFIEETKSGVKGFKDVLQQIMYYVEDKNKSHKKYMGATTHVISSPMATFQTDEFKRQIKRLFDAGKVSSQTAVELIAELDWSVEVSRREKENKSGVGYTCYPQILNNVEDKGLDIPGEAPVKTKDKNNEEIDEDKLSPTEKQEYNIGATYKCECIKCGKKISSSKHCKDLKCSCGGQMRRVNRPGKGETAEKDLEIAPYLKVKDLPANVKKKLTPTQQKKWMKIFNKAYKFYLNKLGDAEKAETIAFRVAWEQVKTKGKK